MVPPCNRRKPKAARPAGAKGAGDGASLSPPGSSRDPEPHRAGVDSVGGVGVLRRRTCARRLHPGYRLRWGADLPGRSLHPSRQVGLRRGRGCGRGVARRAHPRRVRDGDHGDRDPQRHPPKQRDLQSGGSLGAGRRGLEQSLHLQWMSGAELSSQDLSGARPSARASCRRSTRARSRCS